MAEPCPDSRRCLPAWMMKPCSNNEVSSTEQRKKQVVESGVLDQVKPIRRKIKTVNTEAAGEPRALQRCQGKENARRKSKDAGHADKDEFDEMGKINWKNVKKVTGRAAPKNSKKKRLENVGSEASSSGITDDEMELTAGNSRGLQRCQGREMARRKRSDSDYAAKDELEEIEKPTRKNVTKVSGRAAQKNSRKRKLDNVVSEALPSDTSDDEIELTVEDLVSIAEEIVNADKEKRQDGRTTKTARYEENSTRPSASTSTDTGGPTSSAWKGLMQCTETTTNKTPSVRRVDESNRYEEPQQRRSSIEMTGDGATSADTGGPASSAWKGLMQCTATTTNKTPSERRVDESNGYEEPQQRPSSIEKTGDGAQDMLNILLGTMWSKPAAYERKSEPAASEKKSEPAAYEKKSEPAAYEKKSEPAAYEKISEVMEPTTMNVDHVPPPRKEDWQSVTQVQGGLVATKKKSSLKDMVAMFL